MIRSVAAVAALVAARAALPDDKDKDPVRDKLFAAKVAYDKEIQQYRQQATEWLDKREETARKDGNKKAVDQIKGEREAFDEGGELPKIAPTALRQKPVLARKALETAFGLAVKDYVKAKKDDEATAVEKEWKALVAVGRIDLLALVDPKAHATQGECKKDDKGLFVEKHARVQLPYEPGEEYDFEVKVNRVEGDDTFVAGLVAGGRQVTVVLDAWPDKGHFRGFEGVDGKPVLENGTAIKGHTLKVKVDHTIIYSVRGRNIDVQLDGKTSISFKGDFARLSLDGNWAVPNKKSLLLATSNASVLIGGLQVSPVKGKGATLK